MIRRVLVFVGAGVLLTAVETALLAALGIDAVGLHLFLGLVVYLATSADGVEGAAGAAGLGYAFDLFAGTPTGTSVSVSVAIFLVLRVLSQPLDVSGVVVVVLGLLAELMYGVAMLVLLGLVGALGGAGIGSVLAAVAWQTLLAGAMVPLIFAGARRLDRLTGAEQADPLGVWLR